MNEPLVRDTTWMRDDCRCLTTNPEGDGCYLYADYTTGLCAHCQGHALASPSPDVDSDLPAWDTARQPSTVDVEALRAVAEAVDRAMQASLSTGAIGAWADDMHWVPVEALADLPLPCPIRSSITDTPCVLPWGHAPDTDRFHRYDALSESQP